MKMSRNASARSLLQNKISNSKGSFNPHTGKLAEEERGYDPKEQQKKAAREAKAAKAARQAEKSASFSASASTGGAGSRRDEIVRDTGLVSSIRDYRKQQAKKVKTPVKGTIGRKYDPEKGFTVQGLTVKPERSNAKNEKTRLYQTHDNLLSAEEIRKKYSYVAQDKELDYRTMRRAVNNGMRAVGKTLDTAKGDYAELQKVAKLQAQLQGRLRSASFVSGLFEGMAKDSTDAAVKLIGNDALTKQNEAMQELFKQTQSNHKGMATAGKLTGEFAKAGAGYMTIGKAAEEATLKGMGALGRKMTASTAPDLAQKAAAKILLNPKNAKAARVAAGLLGQQAADTMVNTPMTIAAGIGEGKNKKEILKDIGKQEAMDAAFNMGLAALGAGAKKAGQAFKKASKKGPIAGIDFEKMGYQMADVDDGILEHMEYLKNNPNDKKIDYALSPVNERMAKDVSNLVGFDISGYGNNLKPNAFDHVNKRHGADGIHDKSMANPKDIAKVQYILDNYDDVALAKKRAAGFTDSNGKLSQKVVFKKRINGTYYVVEAVPNTKKKRMEVIGTFMQKPKIKKENVLPGDVTSPSVTSKSATAQFSTDIIPKAAEGVKEADAAGATLHTAREETIQAAAQSMAENRNVLAERMTKAERQKMEAELAQLNSAEYRNAKLKEIDEKTGGDPKAIREATRAFEERKQELTKLLTTQETLRTEKGILRDVADEVSSIFNLQGKRSRQQISDALQQVMLEAKEGSISEKTRNELFEQLFRISGESKTGTYGLKKKLREKKLLLGVDAAADIADITTWNHKMKGVLGKIKIGRDTNITPFYNELRRDFPAYFPEGIDNEAEQLRQIRKIAEKLKGNIGLEKSDYQANFNRALDRLTDTMAVKKAYGEKVAAKADAVHSNLLGKIDYGKVTTDEVQGWHKERYRLQKAAERQKNADLSEMEKNVLRDMLDGNVPEVQAQKYLGPRYALVKQQYDIQKPLHDVEEKIIEHKRFVAAKRHKEAAEVIGDIHLKEGAEEGWKDKTIALGYGRETQERNLYDIAPNEKKAKEIIDWAFNPIHENERKRVLMINDSAKALEKLGIDTRNNLNIQLPEVDKKKISESALVQYLGEKEFALRQAQASGAPAESYAELQKEIANIREQLRPEQQERIDKGIVFLQKAYKKLHGMVNEVLIRNGFDPIGYIDGYFPHMNFDDPKDPLLQMAQAMGIDVAAKELPMDIAGRTETFRPRKRWSGNLLERKGTQTDYDALRAFDQYMETVSDVIYHTDDIGRIRSMAEYFRYNLSDEGIKKQIDELRKKKPKTEEELEEIKDQIAKKYADGDKNRKMQNYVNNLELYANLLAGKKHDLDRALEKHGTGRSYYRVIDNISNKVAGNMVAGNIGSALTNLIPATQSMARMSIGSNLRGLKESLVNMAKSDMDELTRRSAFLATRGGTERTYKNWLQKLQETGGNLNPLQWMEAADKFTTQAVWRSRYYDNLKKGMTEDAAIQAADEFARGLFAGRSKGAMPTIFHSKAIFIKPLTMFQLEVNNQLSHIIKDIPREEQKNAVGMFRAYMGIAIGAYIYNDLYEKMTGRRSALDPIGIAREAYGDATGETLRNTLDILGDAISGNGLELTEKREKKAPSAVIEGTAEEIGGNIPFIGGVVFGGGRTPLQSAQPHPLSFIGHIADAEAGEERKEKATAEILRETAIPVATYLNPFVGGGQVRKTLQGINMMRKGGSYTQTNKGEKLQFAVDQDKKTNWLQAALFGKWATPEAQAHMEKNRTLSEKSTETYEKLRQAGAKNTTAFESINKMNREDKGRDKRRAIRSAPLSAEQKAILYRSILKDDQKDKEILDYFSWTNSMGEVADYLMRAADYKSDVPKKAALQDAMISDDEKEYIYMEKFVQDKSKEKEQSRIRALREAGIGMNDYLKIRMKYGQIYDYKDAEARMRQWLQEEGFSWQEQSVIKEQFIFWGMHPKKYKG
ncbi:PBECR3 domain-containing polyvalent protein [Anaerotignum faecicola]|uniref:PBECR3 domain-containing polyvalent protein n=1 Tax=Anaerotignum faecicola TaxID=2358141 RepID=UPI003FD8F3DE